MFRRALLVVLVFAAFRSSQAAWYIAPNSTSGSPEAVWSHVPSGQTNSEILYSYLVDDVWSVPIALTSAAYPSAEPVLTFAPDGTRFAVWDSASGQILLRSLPAAGGTWSSELVLSSSGEVGSSPSAVVEGDLFVSYETSSSSGRAAHVSKADTGGNVERTLLAVTSRMEPLRTQVHAESGYLWVDWIHSETSLGYASYSDGEWESVQYESYESDDVKSARDQIREHVLNGE